MKRLSILLPAVALALGADDLELRTQALLQRRCLPCHGPRTKTAGLDLSTREGALRGGLSGAALKPGSANESLLLSRVLKDQMPPSGPLAADEKQLLLQWINNGAPWTRIVAEQRAGLDWWSLQPLGMHAVPTVAGAPPSWTQSPIDQWIYSRLQQEGLQPSPPADRRMLIRRLCFDLTGLPPAPEEIEAFISDQRADAYERLVDRLLSSPRYGEHWARHWLDVVRFSESEGFERDWLRDHAWSYRDYVIRSFNQDKPYTQFAKEQIAGDVLPPVTRDGIPATGLLVLGPFDAVGLTSAVARERAMVREDQLEEMLGVVSQTFLGLTVNCARCHDHKFDPIPQKDYYRLRAVFDGVWQPVEGEELKADGRVLLTPGEQQDFNAVVHPLQERIARLEASIGDVDRTARRSLDTPQLPQRPYGVWSFDSDTRDDIGSLHLKASADAEVAAGRLRPVTGKESATVTSLPISTDIREKTLEAWIYVRKIPEKSFTPLRIRNLSGFRGASVDGIQYVAGKKKQWENLSTVRFRTEAVDGPPEDTADGARLHIAIVYSSDNTIRIYRNGKPYGKAYKPQVDLPAGRLQTYLRDDAIIELSTSKDLELEEARVYNSALSSDQVAESYQAGVSLATLEDLTRAMTSEQRLLRTNLVAELKNSKTAYAAIRKPEKVFAVDSRPPEPTHLLIRGNVNDKGERVTPGTVSCIKDLSGDLGLTFDASDAARRTALANWIASPNNPLFARVMVNRVWHYHFGAGLVRNPNDFGFNGGTPSHPELLDWLAREFIRSGWSLKKLHKLIVTSQTYRQSSDYQGKASEKDAENRLLSRYSSTRLPAEAVRDAMLAVSGKLNPTIYGPSFRPFTIVRNSGSYHSYAPVDSDDPEQQRRTVYRMNVNSGGNPMLDALDCPVPSVKTPQRSTTTTPLQSLSLMNNPFVQRQARALADRLTREAPDTPSRVQRGFELAFGRAARSEELSSAVAMVDQHGLQTFCWALFNASEFSYVY
jgi:uncharacterized protein DUF1553/uncharacterized protein DUF1549/cytochrome c/concanavalin A-like lectin/glucanase superfamily protein